MFISYTTENSFSFRNRATLSMCAKNTCKERLEETTFSPGTDKTRYLKTITIYGANASGKSNLFKSLASMLARIAYMRNAEEQEPLFPEMPFLLGEEFKSDLPLKGSFHELVFAIDSDIYTYGYEATPDIVHREWLSVSRAGTRKNVELFNRVHDSITSTKYFENADELLARKTRSDTLFLTVCAQFAVPTAEKIVQYLVTSINIISSAKPGNISTARMIDNNELAEEIKRFIKKIDSSIGEIEVESEDSDTGRLDSFGNAITRKKYRVSFKPRLSNGTLADFSLPFAAMASGGTNKAFGIAGYLFRTLKTGGTLFVDELSAMLHPLVTKAIIELFNSEETNPNNAQLIFNTQDLSLLSQRIESSTNKKTNRLFRRDQIYFVEKNDKLESALYSLLSRYKKVRNDASFDKDYLSKKYGALPSIGKIEYPAK